MKLKRHSLFEEPPRGWRCYVPTGADDCVFLPLPIYKVACWWRNLRIWWMYRHVGEVPFRKRFRFEFSMGRRRFHFRLLLGVVLVYLAWNDPCPWMISANLNEVALGWIPWRI